MYVDVQIKPSEVICWCGTMDQNLHSRILCTAVVHVVRLMCWCNKSSGLYHTSWKRSWHLWPWIQSSLRCGDSWYHRWYNVQCHFKFPLSVLPYELNITSTSCCCKPYLNIFSVEHNIESFHNHSSHNRAWETTNSSHHDSSLGNWLLVSNM